MRVLTVVMVVIQVGVGLLILGFVHYVGRRLGIRNRAVTIAVICWTLWSVVLGAVRLLWPDAPNAVWVAFTCVALAAFAVQLAPMVRRNPQILFSRRAIARWRWVRTRIRPTR